MRKKLLAELIGAYILVFAGTGAVMINDITGALGHVGIALTFGFVVVALIYSFAHLSGAHFNPAVTIAFWSIGEFDSRRIRGNTYVGFDSRRISPVVKQSSC